MKSGTNLNILDHIYDDSFFTEEINEHLKGKKIGISGAAGFLGKNWIYFLTYLNRKYNANISIHGYDIVEDLEIFEDSLFAYFKKDFTQKLELKHDYDYFIHGASFASPIKYRQEPLATLYANVNGFENCVDEAKKGKIERLVLLSTSEIYGNPDSKNIPTKETFNGNVSCTGPRACYDESKRLAETLLWIHSNYFNLNAVAIRPFNVYGPGQSINDGRIIPDIMKSLINNETFIMHSDGSPTRTFCFVADFILGSLLAGIKGEKGEAYNVGNNKPEISIKDLLEIVTNLDDNLNFRFKIEESSDKNYLVDNPLRRCPDISKVNNLTKWQPTTNIQDGLFLTIKSYKGAAQ